MPDVGEVRYKAVVDNSGVDQQINQTEKKLDKIGDAAEKTNKQLGNTGHAVSGIKKVGGALGKISIATIKGIGKAFIGLTSAAGAGMAAVAKMGIDYNAQMQSYETAFRTMLGDAEKATALTDKLKTLAAKTPLAMTDLADASKTLLAFGSSAEELPDQLKRLGDVAQGDAQALGTMATAFGRVQSNGYASLEEINMMIDQGFNPLQIIADKTGESMADVRKRVSEGKVSFEELNEALQTATDSGGQFYNAMENQSKTFEGQMSTLKDNVSALAGTLTEDLFAGLAENALPKVNEWVNRLTEAAETEGTAGAIETAGVILTEAVTELLNGAPKFIETATSLVESFLGSIKDNGPQIMDGALDVIMTLLDGFISMVPELIETAGVLIEALINGLADRAPQILSMAVKLVVVLAEGLIKSVPKIIAAAVRLIDSLGGAFLKTDWAKVGIDVVNGIISGLSGAASKLWEAAKNLAKKALDSIKGAFDSHSPSKKAIAIAKTVPQGMVKEWDEDSSAATAAKDLGERAIAGLTADVNYHVPDVGKYAKSLTADFSGSYRAGAEIIVPLTVDGREIARASAWWTGEQLSWEEM